MCIDKYIESIQDVEYGKFGFVLSQKGLQAMGNGSVKTFVRQYPTFHWDKNRKEQLIMKYKEYMECVLSIKN